MGGLMTLLEREIEILRLLAEEALIAMQLKTFSPDPTLHVGRIMVSLIGDKVTLNLCSCQRSRLNLAGL